MKIRVDESYVDALINNAAWDTAKIKLDEKKELSPAQKKMDKDGDGDIEGDDLAKLRKNGKGEDKPEKQEESVDEHICPLCESVLEEELSDDQIFEHVNEILGALDTLNEEADEEEDVDEAMDSEDEDPKEMKKKKMAKEAVMNASKKKKVDELGGDGMSSADDYDDDMKTARDGEKGGKDEAKKSKKEAVMKKVKELKKSAKKA